MLEKSLKAMQGILKRDIYVLRYPGFPIDELKTPDPDPLAAIRYSCVHWVSHFCDMYSNNCPKDQGSLYGDPISRFLRQFCL